MNFEERTRKEANTKLFAFKSNYDINATLLRLTPTEVELFEWLREQTMTSDNWCIEPIEPN